MHRRPLYVCGRISNQLGSVGEDGGLSTQTGSDGRRCLLVSLRQVLQPSTTARQLSADALCDATTDLVQDVAGRSHAMGSRDGSWQAAGTASAVTAGQKPGSLSAATPANHTVRLMTSRAPASPRYAAFTPDTCRPDTSCIHLCRRLQVSCIGDKMSSRLYVYPLVSASRTLLRTYIRPT